MRKKRIITLLCAVVMCAVGLIGVTVVSQAEENGRSNSDASKYLTATNWKNLPGYEYVTYDVKDENGEKYPAEVSFGEDVNGVGINMKVRGYYQALSGDENGNEYAGIVLKEKVAVDGFSVTLTINKLGASSGASPADDGWIGIGLMQKENLWHTANTDINSGAVALLRTSNRAVELVVHEIASDGKGYKVANFTGSPTPPTANIDLVPATEGATLRYSLFTKEDGGNKAYYAKIEQLNFKTGEVVSSRTTSLSLICPNLYIDENGMAYLAISCSTDNFDKSWDISIKNICGTDIGLAEDTAPVSAKQRAQNIYNLIQDLRIYEYFDVGGNLSDEGKAFYVENDKTDINSLVTDLSVQLYNANEEVVAELSDLDAVYSMFDDPASYLAFLNACKEKIIDNYEEVRADALISALTEAIDLLPDVNTITLANEQEAYVKVQNVTVAYNALSERAIEKLGDEYERILIEVIDIYEGKLEEISVEKYLSLLDELPQSVTMDTAKQAIFALIPAESLFDTLSERLTEIESSDYELYRQIVEAKAGFDEVRLAVDELKKTDNRTIEGYESGATVRNAIFYLPKPALANHAESVFATLVKYTALSSDVRTEISVDERQALLTACQEALIALILQLPAEKDVTAENYIVNGYDIVINNANNYFNLLDEADYSLTENLTGKDKLKNLVAKLSVVANPLSAVIVESKTVNAGEIISLSFGDMFNNFFGLDYQVTVNYGNVDKMLESYSVSFDEAGEYQVKVTITDTVYGQEAICQFTVKVNGNKSEKKGCGSNMGTEGVYLFAFAVILGFSILKRKEVCL